ncbi:MAG: exo-alpha-sialidase [Phycisphaerales bacterium JB043]
MHHIVVIVAAFGLHQSAPAQLTSIPSPAGPDSQAFRLVADGDDSALLIWHEKAAEQPELAEGEWVPPTWDLNVSRFVDGAWSSPVTIDSRDDYFVNWADTPCVARAPSGELLITWLQKSGPGTYTYDIHAATSHDEGATWNHLGVIHDDGVKSEHGFVSMTADDDALRLIWLDGRNMTAGEGGHANHGSGGSMTARTALYRDGAFIDSKQLDDRTCECCATDLAITPSGPVVIYRDRSHNETRDIAVVRSDGDGWSRPTTIWPDNWIIPACPVNGPAIDASDQLVAVAWFTAGKGAFAVNTIFSHDAGRTFGRPVTVEARSEQFHPVGRIDLVVDDESALVSYLRDDLTSGGAQVVLRRVDQNSGLSDAQVIASLPRGRATGFPKLIHIGDQLMVAWTTIDADGTTQIKTTTVAPPPQTKK